MPDVTETIPAQENKVFTIEENADEGFTVWLTPMSENLSRDTLQAIYDAIGECLGVAAEG